MPKRFIFFRFIIFFLNTIAKLHVFMLTNKKMSDKLQYRYLFLTVGAKTKQKDILLSPFAIIRCSRTKW